MHVLYMYCTCIYINNYEEIIDAVPKPTGTPREPAVFFRVCACACESGRGKGRKNTSGHTGQVFVAPTQDLELTNQTAATRKLHVN